MMSPYNKITVLPGAFAWSRDLLRELAASETLWEDVAGFLDVDCETRLVSDDYYEHRQGKQLFLKDLAPAWLSRLRDLIEETTGYTGQLMQPRVVKYEKGDQFLLHRDWPHLNGNMVRTRSFCAYLTDTDGGELHFKTGVRVRPRAGLVVVFEPNFEHSSLIVHGETPKIVIVTWFVEPDEWQGDSITLVAANEP